MLINAPLSSFAIQAYTHIKAIIKCLRQARTAISWWIKRKIKSLNGFNHQILVFENLFSCSGFRGLCPPRRFSKTHSRKSWAITRVYNLSDNNELVRFVQSRMNEFIILQILLAVYARFTRVLQNLDENLIFKVLKKDIFSTSRSDVSNMFYESQFLSNVHSTLLLAKYYWIIN